MQQPDTTLIYWTTSRVRFNLTLILAVGVILFGLYQWVAPSFSGDDAPAPTESSQQSEEGEAPQASSNSGSAWLLILVGLGVGAYSWLTTPRQYRVHSEALVIMFGMPRRRTIHFSDIREVANDRGFMGDPLRVYTMNRRRIPLQVREPEEMYGYLDSALKDFRRANPQYAPPPEPEPEDTAPDVTVVDSAAPDGADPAPTASEPVVEDTSKEPPTPAPQRSPRSRRRSLRDDAPSDRDDV